MTNKACVRVVELICSAMPAHRGKLVGKVGAEYAVLLFQKFKHVSDEDFGKYCLPIIYQMNTIPSISDFLTAWKRHINTPPLYKALPRAKTESGFIEDILKNQRNLRLEDVKNNSKYKQLCEKTKEQIRAKFKDITDEQIEDNFSLLQWYIENNGVFDGRKMIIDTSQRYMQLRLGSKETDDTIH